MLHFLLLILSLVTVIKSADFAIHYSSQIATHFRLAKHIVGFLVVALISILPETFISVASALQGVPSLGLGTLFGSNVADLTLVFAIVVFFSAHALKIEQSILFSSRLYILIMAGPIIFGLNGHYSRIEGVGLILLGILFYLWIIRNQKHTIAEKNHERFSWRYVLYLLLSMGSLLLGSHFTVTYGVVLAQILHVNPVLIGLLVLGVGTTLPELFFSIRAIRRNQDGLALGDILGTVVTDATIVVGVVALISPFHFNSRITYITGFFMLAAVFFLFDFMNSGKKLTKKEGVYLLLFYALFVTAELIANSL